MGIGFMIKGPGRHNYPRTCYRLGFILISLRNWEELSQLRLGYGATILMQQSSFPWFSHNANHSWR